MEGVHETEGSWRTAELIFAVAIQAHSDDDGNVVVSIPPDDPNLQGFSSKEFYLWTLTLDEAVDKARKFLAAVDLGVPYQVSLPTLSATGEAPVLLVSPERSKRLGLLLLHTVEQIERGRHLN